MSCDEYTIQGTPYDSLAYKNPNYRPNNACFRIGGTPCCMAICSNGYRCQRPAAYAHRVKQAFVQKYSCENLNLDIPKRELVPEMSVPRDEILLCDKHTAFFTNDEFLKEGSGFRYMKYMATGTAYAACILGVTAATTILGPIGGVMSASAAPFVQNYMENVASKIGEKVVDAGVETLELKKKVPPGTRELGKYAGFGVKRKRRASGRFLHAE